MIIANNSVVTLNYVLKDDDGEIIDASDSAEFVYLHGSGNIITGLEKALEGKELGEHVSVVIAPEDAYGELDPNFVQGVSRDQFPENIELEVGKQFHGESPTGEAVVITVAQIEGDEIVIDGNHELAGLTLHFELDIVEVRPADAEEVEHGHVHGAGGHQH